MTSRYRPFPAVLTTIVVLLFAQPGWSDDQLVANPMFARATVQGLPEAWTVWHPEVESARCAVRSAAAGLVVDAPGRPFAISRVQQDVKRIDGGRSYAIDARCTAERIASPFRSLMVRWTWTRGGKSLHPAGTYLRGPRAADGRLTFHDVLTAPKDADGGTLALELKWPQGGSVRWEQASVRPSSPLPPRKVKIGTVYLRPRQSTPARNLEFFCDQIEAAGRLGLDIVCLPEAITMIGTGKTGPQTAEPIPGPSTERLGAAAKKNRLWVVAGLYERDGQTIYNTAVLMDREGRLAGKYRKIHLPREEWEKGVTPGSEYPVFKTEFGTVAIQICYDWFFPELGTIFGLKGAEIVFAPTWGTTFPDQEGRVEGENVFRVRARDNGFYLVPSVYDGSSMVIDPLGRVLASNRGREGVFWCEADLNHREPLPWVGQWRALGPRDRMPGTYSQLLSDPPAK